MRAEGERIIYVKYSKTYEFHQAYIFSNSAHKDYIMCPQEYTIINRNCAYFYLIYGTRRDYLQSRESYEHPWRGKAPQKPTGRLRQWIANTTNMIHGRALKGADIGASGDGINLVKWRAGGSSSYRVSILLCVALWRCPKALIRHSKCSNKIANTTNMINGRALKGADIGASGGLCRAGHSNQGKWNICCAVCFSSPRVFDLIPHQFISRTGKRVEYRRQTEYKLQKKPRGHCLVMYTIESTVFISKVDYAPDHKNWLHLYKGQIIEITGLTGQEDLLYGKDHKDENGKEGFFLASHVEKSRYGPADAEISAGLWKSLNFNVHVKLISSLQDFTTHIKIYRDKIINDLEEQECFVFVFIGHGFEEDKTEYIELPEDDSDYNSIFSNNEEKYNHINENDLFYSTCSGDEGSCSNEMCDNNCKGQDTANFDPKCLSIYDKIKVISEPNSTKFKINTQSNVIKNFSTGLCDKINTTYKHTTNINDIRKSMSSVNTIFSELSEHTQDTLEDIATKSNDIFNIDKIKYVNNEYITNTHQQEVDDNIFDKGNSNFQLEKSVGMQLKDKTEPTRIYNSKGNHIIENENLISETDRLCNTSAPRIGYPIRLIYEEFTPEKCPNLIGVPKLFYIQRRRPNTTVQVNALNQKCIYFSSISKNGYGKYTKW
ncbi:unnamed protein product, partial [Meganyctiphanes norvegica]